MDKTRTDLLKAMAYAESLISKEQVGHVIVFYDDNGRRRIRIEDADS